MSMDIQEDFESVKSCKTGQSAMNALRWLIRENQTLRWRLGVAMDRMEEEYRLCSDKETLGRLHATINLINHTVPPNLDTRGHGSQCQDDEPRRGARR